MILCKGIVIKAPARILIFLVIFTIFAVIIGAYIMTEYTQHARLIYPYGLTDRDKADALRIAMEDPDIRESIMEQGGQYSVGVETGNETGNSGFINVSGKFMLVEISAGQGSRMPMFFIVLADIAHGREMEARYTYDVMAMPTRVSIPPGASWYRLIRNTGSPGNTSMSVTLEPNNTTVYPMILNRSGFESYKNGQPFQALSYTDLSTGQPTEYNGSVPASSGWTTNVTYNDDTADDEFYLVLTNRGNEDIVARFGVSPPGY